RAPPLSPCPLHDPLPIYDRPRPPGAADERTMLAGWLDFHRATLEMKCAGLTPEQLVTRSAPPSTLSLLGLVRHMADVERAWFRRDRKSTRLNSSHVKISY